MSSSRNEWARFLAEGRGIKQPGKPVKPAPPKETAIQQACISWFRLQYPRLWQDGVLFHIPNEGKRGLGLGHRMKGEGLVAGVADLCLAMGRRGYNALYVEMKRPGNKQTALQQEWERGVSKHGNLYKVCHSLEEFQTIIAFYLNES